jgi:hypothetical protein
MPIAQLHLHVDGEGYLRFARGSQAVYSADATLTTSSGVLASQDGYPLLPQIHVPSDGAGVKVEIDGTVTISGAAAGRIVLASFGATPLQKLGVYFTCSGRSSIGYPGDGILGVIRCSKNGSKTTQAVTRPTGQQAGLTIEVRLHSELEKPHILLGDIADFSGSQSEQATVADLDLGAMPILGAERGISRTYILAVLRSQGIVTDKINIICPVGSTVVRKSQKVTEDALIAAAMDGAKTKLGIDFAMRCQRDVPDVIAPTGELQINARDATPNGDGATVDLEIDVDGTAVARRTVALVPSVAVPEVHAGDPLKVRIEKNGATVEISGKARAGARVGGTVTVETENGASFTGLLKTLSIVEVKL